MILLTTTTGKKCKVSKGTHSSNVSINRWFNPDGTNKPTLAEIQGKTNEEKSIGNRRLAYQVPHTVDDACGRSFEDAFMLANSKTFGINDGTADKRESEAWEAAKKVDKTEFALKHAICDTSWAIPKYIEEGLLWLSEPGDVKAEEGAPDDTV